MTAKTLEAIFENGVFRPVAKPAGIVEGQRGSPARIGRVAKPQDDFTIHIRAGVTVSGY